MEIPKFGSFKPRTKISLAEQEKSSIIKEEGNLSEHSRSHRVEKGHRSQDRDRDRERDQHRRHEGQDRDHRRHRHVRDERERTTSSKHERLRIRDADLSLKSERHEDSKHATPIKTDECEESNIFIIDRRGDSKNVEYGSLHRYSIPAYRRTGYGNVVGRSLSWKIDREASNEKEVFLISSAAGKKAHQKASRLLSSKYGRSSETRLKFVSAAGQHTKGEAENDFIELSSSRKRKRGSEVPEPDMGVDYRCILGKAKASNKPADADVDYASDSDNTERNDLDLCARQQSALLSKKAKANPSVLEPWLALAEHQSQLVRPGGGESLLTTSEKTTLGELRLSILSEAGKTISRGKTGRERLLLAIIEEGTPLWDKAKLAAKWKDVLKECPASVFLWTRYMDYIQYEHSSFQYETCKEVYLEWLQTLKTAHGGSSGKVSDGISEAQIYALLRYTTFIRDAGYDELATGIWQALLELHFLMPKELETSSVEARLESLEDYWDMETPRIGEEGTMTWTKFHEDGPSNATRRTPIQAFNTSIDPRSPFTSIAREEARFAKVFLLPASTEDEDAVTDPFRCIMFDDLRSTVESLSTDLPKGGLISAFLQYAGLPPLPSGSVGAGDWNTDPYLAWGSESSKVRSQRESTFSLFENAFQDFHTRHNNGTAGFARFVERVLEVFLQSHSGQENSRRDYFLAFKAEMFPQEAPKAAKKLLKAYPTSLHLYNAYALIEARAGRTETAMGVWDAALGMLPKLDAKAQGTAVLLWHSRFLTQVEQGHETVALQMLLAVANFRKATGEDTSNHVTHLRLRRELESRFDHMLLSERFHHAVLYADLLAWLTYLTQDITSAITSYNHHITTLSRSATPAAVEELQQCKSRTMTLHIDRQRPYKPSAFQQEVVNALDRFPNNSVLLELHSRIASQDRLRHLVSEQKRSGTEDMSIIQWSFKLHTEISRASDVVGGTGGGTVNTVRATASTALLSPGSRISHSVALWKSWLDFEIERGDIRKARNVFLDGLRALPGIKGWVVEGLRQGVLEERDMRKVWEGCVERGLRFRVGIEEFI